MTKKSTHEIRPTKLHEGTGKGYAVFDGECRYFGRRERPEAKSRYDQAVAEWLAARCRVRVEPTDLPRVELRARFLA